MSLNTELFRTKINQKFGSIKEFSNHIPYTRVTVQNWLSKKRVPTIAIFEVGMALELNPSEVDDIFDDHPLRLRFRRKGRAQPKNSIKEKCKEFARSVFNLSDELEESILPIHPNLESTTNEIAKHIRTHFKLTPFDAPISLSSLLHNLRKRNIYVFFIPFEQMGLTNKSSNRIVAFTSEKNQKYCVFLDVDRSKDEILWDLCHELVHVICGHFFEDQNKKEKEDVCQKVTEELIYPKEFLLSKTIVSDYCKKPNFKYSFLIAKNLCHKFNWSPKGLAAALESYGLIEKSSSHSKILYSTYYKTQNERPSLIKHFKNFVPESFVTVKEFFSKDIYIDDIYSIFHLFKNSAIFDFLSPGKLSQLLNIPKELTEELIYDWKSELPPDNESCNAT